MAPLPRATRQGAAGGALWSTPAGADHDVGLFQLVDEPAAFEGEEVEEEEEKEEDEEEEEEEDEGNAKQARGGAAAPRRRRRRAPQPDKRRVRPGMWIIPGRGAQPGDNTRAARPLRPFLTITSF